MKDGIINRNVSYYIIGQIAKFIKPGAIRTLSSSSDASIATTSFNLKNGKKAILILTIIEMVFCLVFILFRIDRINLFNKQGGIRELINPYDYENGWNIIFSSILFYSCSLLLRVS